MLFFQSDDPVRDREEFDIQMSNNPQLANLYNLLEYKEKDVRSDYEEDDLVLRSYMVPVEILPRKYAMRYNPERGEVIFEFCSRRFSVCTTDGKINYFSILTGFHRSITNVSRSSREKQMSDFIYLMGSKIYRRSVSKLNYLQQREIHDLSVTFDGISCIHQREVANFDPDCENCTLRF